MKAQQNEAREVRTIGIAGGGQLAQMMLPAADGLGLEVVVSDPDPACSASGGVREVIVGTFDSEPALRQLAEHSDALTFEIERVNAQVLAALEQEGHVVRPPARVLEIIQDKLVQKRFLEQLGVPVGGFAEWAGDGPLPLELPCVWKARRDGYDGRGVAILRDARDVSKLDHGAAMIEALADIDYELAILVCRDVHGTVDHFPLVEIVMDPDSHVMDRLIAPAAVPAAVEQQCREIAAAVAEALDYVGVLALEFFVERNGRVLVNELSPRPHNSAHYTIEACACSQFEQHVRAVAGLRLASTELLRPAVTFNVLGAAHAQGEPRYIGFDTAAKTEGVHVHCYDKPVVRPGRKMAHVTVLADTRQAAVALADKMQANIRVEAQDD